MRDILLLSILGLVACGDDTTELFYGVLPSDGIQVGDVFETHVPEGTTQIKVIPVSPDDTVSFFVSTEQWVLHYGTNEKMGWEPIDGTYVQVGNTWTGVLNFAVFYEVAK